MRNLLVVALLFILTSEVKAQEIKIDLGYKYLFANKWDKAIQTYNFSRPNLVEKQPLFMNGLTGSFTKIFKSTKRLNHGINFSYSYFRSWAQNESSINSLNLHFFNVGYTLHYESKEKLKGLYTDLIIAATSSGLFRYVDGKPFVYDEKKSKAFGVGGEINLKMGYYLKIKNDFFFSPFIQLGYTPYFFSPQTETVINQTKSLSSKNWTGILNAQIGVAFHIIKSEQELKIE